MKIAVDGWRVHGTTGVARYVANVLSGWSVDRLPPSVEPPEVLTPRPIDRSRLAIPDGVRERVVASDSSQLVWQNTIVSRVCDADVLWCPAYVVPVRSRARIVVTTHDATNAIHPELYRWRDRLFYRRFYAWCARSAALVITNNETTKADLTRHYGVDAGKIRVVPLAPANRFRRLDDQEAARATARRLLGDGRRFFLSVGKISMRRNVPTIIEAFARLRERTGVEHRLVVIGRNGLDRPIPALFAEHGITDHATYLDYVTDDELVDLYNAAEGFVTAATYEANSFTVIEAQASGTPVVIPDVPGMRESTGEVAVVAPGVGVDEIAHAMGRLATEPELVSRLRAEGVEQVSRFSWDRTSDGVLQVLCEAQ